MSISNIIGATLGIKLINGKIKPKFGIKAIISIIILFLLFAISLLGFIYGLLNFDIELLFAGVCGLFGFGYLLLISPYTQNSKNYHIEFETENSLHNFKLSYKNKQVNIQYKIDKTKYKIINYFTRWLNDNNLMSNEITTTFEKL